MQILILLNDQNLPAAGKSFGQATGDAEAGEGGAYNDDLFGGGVGSGGGVVGEGVEEGVEALGEELEEVGDEMAGVD